MKVANASHLCFTKSMTLKHKNLNELQRNEAAKVCGFTAQDEQMVLKLREIGFAEGDEVEVLSRGIFGGTPLSVRVNQTIIALRLPEARLVKVGV